MSEDTQLSVVGSAAMDFFKNEDNKVDQGDMSSGASYPTLKIVQKNNYGELKTIDGKDASLGSLFDTGTQQSFAELNAHVLAIKVGTLPGYQGGKDKYTTIISWWVPVLKQVVMTFVSGKSLEPLWNWQKEVDKLNRQFGVPLYALVTKISSIKNENKYGTFYQFQFSVAREKDGKIAIEGNVDNLALMRDLINGKDGKKMKDILSQVFVALNGEDDGTQFDVSYTAQKPSKELKAVEESEILDNEDLSEDIPF